VGRAVGARRATGPSRTAAAGRARRLQPPAARRRRRDHRAHPGGVGTHGASGA
jgi:hypothetical protein